MGEINHQSESAASVVIKKAKKSICRASNKLAYAEYKWRMDKGGIPALSIPKSLAAYAQRYRQSIHIISGSHIAIAGVAIVLHLLLMEKGIFFPLLLGLLRRDEVDGNRWALLSRVSTGSQMAGQSTKRQLNNLEKEVKKVEGVIRKKVEVAESAATLKRETLEEIATLAEEGEIDIVGVSKLDRLTRADPWESFVYLKRLKEADVTLYAGTHGYFDWDDLYDFQMLVRQVVFSREWYQRIRDNARDGQVGKLEKGKWPFGQPPFGYCKDEDDYVSLTEQGEEIIPEIFELYCREQNRAEVKRIINDRYDRTISDSQVKTLLRSRLCLGQLTLESEIIKKDPRLAVIDLEAFNAAQEILNKRSSVPTGTRAVPEPVERAAKQYGEEYVLTLIDTIDTKCRKCGGNLQHNGDIERWGTKLKNYVCQECDHQGPLLTQEEFNELHDTLPLRCPSCPETEHFEIDRNEDGGWEYSYTCLRCDNVFGTDLLPDKYRRGFERPDLKFTWSGDTSTDQAREDLISDEDGGSELNQVALTDF